MSDKAKFRREIYCLEFSFKPLRMIEVDVPRRRRRRPSGSWFGTWSTAFATRAKYSSRSKGKDGVYSTELGKGGPVRFLPQFVLESQDRQATGEPRFESRISIA